MVGGTQPASLGVGTVRHLLEWNPPNPIIGTILYYRGESAVFTSPYGNLTADAPPNISLVIGKNKIVDQHAEAANDFVKLFHRFSGE